MAKAKAKAKPKAKANHTLRNVCLGATGLALLVGAAFLGKALSGRNATYEINAAQVSTGSGDINNTCPVVPGYEVEIKTGEGQVYVIPGCRTVQKPSADKYDAPF